MEKKMPDLITVATAECFTHGKVAREVHAFARGYPLGYPWEINRDKARVSLVCGLFIPTISGVESVLRFEPMKPICAPEGIKVYDQKRDLAMAVQMATAVKKMTRSQIGIGTSAGIGTGGIAVVTNELTITATTDVHADLRTSDAELIMRRQDAGVNEALRLFQHLLKNGF